MKKEITISIFVSVVIIASASTFLLIQNKTEPTSSIRNDDTAHTEEDYGTMVFDVYSGMHVGGLKAFHDHELMVFYENDLQKTCPFYKPNGVSYRDCVVVLQEKERARLAKNLSAISTVEKYCSDGAAQTMDDTSLGYVDIYNTCMVYRLRLIPL